jgi:hypothetical protein
MTFDLRLLACLVLAGLLCASGEAVSKLDPFARSIQLDRAFAYYQDRSVESIASEVKANGYGCVRLAVVCDSAADGELVQAFHKAGIAVWYTTFGNGTYSTADFPPGWEAWKMKLKDPKASAGGFQYICLNDPEYRVWKKKQVVATLKRIPFDGFEMAEPFWPAYKGPESPLYGCLCDNCRSAFLRMYPDTRNMPNFTDEKSLDYYKTNPDLYVKWVEFRAKSVASFHDDIINGPGGVRESFPKVKIATWGIADDVPNPVETIKEWEGIDGPLLVKTVHPDLHVIQTDWPDWMKPGLPAEYPLKYKPFVEAIRAVSKVPIIMQADIGSSESCRRGSDWMRRCEAATRKAGMVGVFSYEYHLSLDMYEAPPLPISASGAGQTVTLTFNKRLDAAKAADPANYTARPGKVLSARVDGNLVKLQVQGRPSKVTVRNLADDPTRRFFKNHPAAIMQTEKAVSVRWPH